MQSIYSCLLVLSLISSARFIAKIGIKPSYRGMVCDLMYQFNKLSGFGNAKEIISSLLQKSPSFIKYNWSCGAYIKKKKKKKIQVSAALISREEQCEEWRWSPHTSQLSIWWHGWHNWETLLCPLLYRLTVLISLTQLRTDSCQNYSDAKCVNSGWEWRIENNFFSVNQPCSDRSRLKFTSLIIEAYQSSTYVSFIFFITGLLH